MVWWCLVHGVVDTMVRNVGDNMVGGRYRSVKTLADQVIAGLGENHPLIDGVDDGDNNGDRW